jgi:hypothetical protein
MWDKILQYLNHTIRFHLEYLAVFSQLCMCVTRIDNRMILRHCTLSCFNWLYLVNLASNTVWFCVYRILRLVSGRKTAELLHNPSLVFRTGVLPPLPMEYWWLPALSCSWVLPPNNWLHAVGQSVPNVISSGSLSQDLNLKRLLAYPLISSQIISVQVLIM